MAKIEYSPKAILDIEQIGDYIEREYINPIAAYNTVNMIQETIDNLTVFPFMGTPLSSIVDIITDYRFLVCGNYLAFHRANDDVVYIDRVLHGKRDYLAVLFPGLQRENQHTS
jgi:plasmid stabilization system protein ParE